MRGLQGLAAAGLMAVSVCLPSHATASDHPTSRQLGEADRYCRFGAQALKSGNMPKARSMFQKAMKAFPAFPDAHLGMGHVAMGSKKFDEALAEYKTARSAYIDFSDALFDLQLLHYDQAQDRITKLRDEIGNYRRQLSAQPLGESSVLERRVTELEQEIQQLELVRSPAADVKKREAPGEVYFYIGNALFNLGRLEEAVVAWESCVHESPKFPLVYNNLAVAYWKQGRIDQARDRLDQGERLGLPVNARFRADLERSASGPPPSTAALPSNP